MRVLFVSKSGSCCWGHPQDRVVWTGSQRSSEGLPVAWLRTLSTLNIETGDRPCLEREVIYLAIPHHQKDNLLPSFGVLHRSVAVAV